MVPGVLVLEVLAMVLVMGMGVGMGMAVFALAVPVGLARLAMGPRVEGKVVAMVATVPVLWRMLLR